MRVLIAGIGNVLRGDDGFGPAVVQLLERRARLPQHVRLVELGIGGIGLVHELMDGYDGLVLIDAVDRGGTPGSLYVFEPLLPLEAPCRLNSPGDMHQAVPAQALAIARAAGALPSRIRFVGCQPAETEELLCHLSQCVQLAVTPAAEAAERIVNEWIGASVLRIPPTSDDSPGVPHA